MCIRDSLTRSTFSATNVFVAEKVDRVRWKTGNWDENLHRNNVARQVEGFCISYFAALSSVIIHYFIQSRGFCRWRGSTPVALLKPWSLSKVASIQCYQDEGVPYCLCCIIYCFVLPSQTVSGEVLGLPDVIILCKTMESKNRRIHTCRKAMRISKRLDHQRKNISPTLELKFYIYQ